MKFRNALTFVGTIAAQAIIHMIFSGKPDDHDMTQFWIFAAMVTILEALNRKAPTHD